MKSVTIIILILLYLPSKSLLISDTWDEPWQKEIIESAEYFVLAKIIDFDEDSGIEIEILNYFGDTELTGNIRIEGFLNLDLHSSSGHLHYPEFAIGQTAYFFLANGEEDEYLISTPTSGFSALNKKDEVLATYRHSFHQAIVPKEIYEKSYKEIWSYYKTSNYDREIINALIDQYIDLPPAGFDEDEINTFFIQHVALETAYLLDIPISLDRLKPFVKLDNMHSSISALQLMGNSKDKETKDYLYNFIVDENNNNFEKVIAIWALAKIGDKVYFEKLNEIAETQSDDYIGFDCNIMDPRVSTYFPSPKRAIEDLIEE